MHLDLEPVTPEQARRLREQVMKPFEKHPDYQQYIGGPRSPEGKRIASLNAVKTGLTGRSVLMAGDDGDAYRALQAKYEATYKPEGLRETEIVETLVDARWRIDRSRRLITGLFARGAGDLCETHADQDYIARRESIEIDSHVKYAKEIHNLELQEQRLIRRFKTEQAELFALQAARQPAPSQAQPKPEPKPAPAKAAHAGGEFVFSKPPAPPAPVFNPALKSVAPAKKTVAALLEQWKSAEAGQP